MKWVFILAVAILFAATPLPAVAASGITVTQATANVTLAQSETGKRLTITLHNSTRTAADITLAAADFGALESTGGLFFLGESANNVWDRHRLAKWITITPGHLALQPGNSATVQVDIRNDESLSPGGHYAAIMAKVSGETAQKQLSINQVVSSLLFVTKEGGEQLGLSVKGFDASIAWFGGASSADMRLTNTGNAHAVPRGVVTLRGPFDQVLGRGIINQASSPLLPGITRTFDLTLTPSGIPLWPGLYMVQAQYRYDGSDRVQTVSKSVFYPGLLGILAIALVIFGALFYVVRRRRSA
jgi:hypothetical protein